MTGPLDPYREWDAAYLLGALSPDERREYEVHLATCSRCSAEVASLAGLSGILAAVPSDKALQLASRAPEEPGPPEDLMPRLAAKVDKLRRRARRRTVALVAAAAAIAAAVVWVVPDLGNDAPEVAGRDVSMVRVGPARPLRASAHLVSEPWGTKIEASCSYDLVQPSPGVSPQRQFEYAMYVTGRAGTPVKVATWMAIPGATATAYGTVTMPMDQISKVDIRSVRTGTVLLQAVL